MNAERNLSGFAKVDPPPDRSIPIPPPAPAPTIVNDPKPDLDAKPADQTETPAAAKESVADPPKETPEAPTDKQDVNAESPRSESITTRLTATVPPDLLQRAREAAEEDDIWVSDIVRQALLTFAHEIGAPPSGRRSRSRKTGNYVTLSVVLEPAELEVLNRAAGEGRNRSWVIRAVLRRQLNTDSISVEGQVTPE